MTRSPHLWVVLSGHGFGHLAQAAPVLNALRRRLPALKLTIQSPLPDALLRARIEGEFEQLREAADVGMVMANAVDVRLAESRAAYQAFHADWGTRLARQEKVLVERAPQLVFADVPYLPLAAAARQGIPAVALCSLNWADIVAAYWPDDKELANSCALMRAAYSSAAVFLRPTPSMPMSDLANAREIGPIAALGRNRRDELNRRLGLRDDQTLALAGLGGYDLPLPAERWPQAADVHWLMPAACGRRQDFSHREQVADMPFIDLLCSCDALLAKPGYGTFSEAVCNGKPVLYLERPGWPETPWLTRWLVEHGNARLLERRALTTGAVLEPLRRLLAQPRKPALPPTGVAAAVDCLYSYLVDD